jgi:pyridoxal phosphate enzyme (YggS family)
MNGKDNPVYNGDNITDGDEATRRLTEVSQRIAAACRRTGRNESEVTLVAASKTVTAASLVPYLRAGLNTCGENYVQEGITKQQEVASLLENEHLLTTEWHLIGALQSNKARVAVENFELIHSLDRPTLAKELHKAAGTAGKQQRVLLQVNLSGEASKAGCAPEVLMEFAQLCSTYDHLLVEGLMCLPEFNADPEQVRPSFARLRILRDALLQHGLVQGGALSMGMSGDFETAIEEGATLVRVGTALFGAR